MPNLITNIENNTVFKELNSFGEIEEILIASPFLSDNSFLAKLLALKYNIKIIVRLCSHTNPKALKKLLAHEFAEVKFFIEETFHSKIYIVNNRSAIFGSSNFTDGGLRNNSEINISIDSNNPIFYTLVDVFDYYWSYATTLTLEGLCEFESIIHQFKIQHEGLDDFSALLTKATTLLQPSNSHGFLSPDARERQIAAVKSSLSKPVVCLNNRHEYNSLLDAAKTEYGMPRGYGYIAAVCRGEKRHYKGYLWKFKNDYLLLSNDDIEGLLRKYEQEKENYKVKDKYLFENQVFNTQKLLLDYLNDTYRCNTTKQYLSSEIKKAKNIGISVCTLYIAQKDRQIYFAEYYQLYKNGIFVEETPCEKGLEEIEKFYTKFINMHFGDCDAMYAIETAKTKSFYKFGGEYYRNRSSIFPYDEKSKSTVLKLLDSGEDYILCSGLTREIIEKSKKNSYYLMDKRIFRTAKDFMNKFVQTLTKDELMLELDMLK